MGSTKCGAFGIAAILGLVVALPACASLLGFEDARDLDEGGVGTATPDSASDAPASGPCNDTCVAAPPPGWDGPVAYFEATGGPPPPTPPACAAPYGTIAYEGTGALVAPAATCGCTCAGAAGITCAAPIANFFSDASCANTCGTKDQPLATAPACTALGLGACTSTHLTIGPSLPSGGSCSPQPTATVPPLAWSTAFRLCRAGAPAAGACGAGQVCAAKPSLPQHPDTLCIARPGDGDCPSGYPMKKTAFASATDTRACTACTCDSPAGASCSARVATTNTDLACAAGPKSLSIPQLCANLGTVKSANVSAASVTGGACAASKSVAAGAATPTSPTTICCTM